MTRQTLFVIETFAIDAVIARRLAVRNRPTDGAYALRRDSSRNRSTMSGTRNEAEAHVAPHYERLRRTDASFLLRGAAASIAAKWLQGHKAQYATRTRRWC